MIEFQQDIKYQLTTDAQWKLTSDVRINYSFSTPWYGVDKDRRLLWAKAGFAWDGATKYPDFDWILEASLWHDVLHLLIAVGAIHVNQNDEIDRELSNCIMALGAPKDRSEFRGMMLKFRAFYVRKTTNIVDQKYTPNNPRPIYRLDFGERTRVR